MAEKNKPKSKPAGPKTPHVLKLKDIQTHLECAKRLGKFSSIDPSLRETFLPYLLPSILKGTQVVQIRLTLSAYKITVASGVSYTTVLAVDAAKFANFLDCADLFDEYRFVKGSLQYHAANNAVTNTNFGGAAIDYSIATAFGSFDAMAAHDTHKVGHFNNFASFDSGKARFKWPIILDGVPDQEWSPTTSTGTVVCYWKPFINSSFIQSSEDIGFLLGWMDFQFRGLAG
jgi:hypothetical protein